LGSSGERYWDGAGWTPQVRGGPPDENARRRTNLWVGWVLGGLAILLFGGLIAVGATQSRTVPDVRGMSLAAAARALEEEDLDVVVVGSPHGRVQAQDPAPGDGAVAGEDVTLYFSTGTGPPVTQPAARRARIPAQPTSF
jgi:hypothetical protein